MIYYGRMRITTGRGADRQEVALARNIEAPDRGMAIEALQIWAETEVSLYHFMHLPDTRITYDVALGASPMPAATG